MLVALVPIFGASAYLASEAMMKKGLGRILIDHSAQKLPFRLYDRLGLAGVLARTPK